MADRYTGIEIGSRQIKMTQCSNHCVYRVATQPLPDNYVDRGAIVSNEAMSEILREMAKTYHFTDKKCAVVLPDSVAFSRRLTMPAMTVDQLKINLPYEFHDFISDSKKGYVFDYSLLEMSCNEEGRPVSMDLMAAAAPKEKIREYEMMLKRAGFKLAIAAPEVFAYSNIIREHEAVEGGGPKEYCFIDIGHNYTKIHIFTGCRFEVTREIEYGCSLLQEAVAGEFNVDEHVARSYVIENFKKVWDMQRCRDIYETIAVEVMRAINFYGFNNPSSQLDRVYFCGGGSMIPNLKEAIADQISLQVRPVSELLTVVGDIPDEAFISPAAAGITYL
ncbi:MAG: pilus assembly protein PilM [Clostridium sp.]|nr:pilus assembly protein PilM [Clostridium sp.]